MGKSRPTTGEPSPSASLSYTTAGLGGQSLPGERPALVVVDLSSGFTDPESRLACDTDGAVAATSELLEEFRGRHWLRVFTTVAYRHADLKVAASFIAKAPALASLTVGSRWVEIDARLAPSPDEHVLTKIFASAFFGTVLASLLTVANCDTVVVTGASTSGCVRATVVDALQHGFKVVVPREAVADRAVDAHEASLVDIAAKYGEVWTVATTLAWLRSCP